MKYRILGDNLQILIIELAPGEKVYAEAGALNHMSGNIKMDVKAKGGLGASLKRAISGESFFVTEFSAEGGPGIVSFGGTAPGKIAVLELDGTREYLIQRGGFLVAEDGVEVTAGIARKLGAALFGGEGLIMERVRGRGKVFIHAAGDFIEYDLAPDQVLKVDTGHLVALEDSVDFDIQRVGGIKSILFSGEGLFFAVLRGPGKVILQSLNVAALAREIARHIPQSGNRGFTFSWG
ncbi:MAG TPA: TIGR00266 family protein [Candidatus Korarchaeota archaeon]|nr:TIGR00266 family protein [Candidatus Korarchaeota archaeon]